MKHGPAGRAGAAVVLAMGLSGCVPWTVRPIGEAGSPRQAAPVVSPAEYVDSIWASKLVPALRTSAVDARTLLDALAASADGAKQKYGRHESGGAWFFSVRGAGKVLAVDTRSRAGFVSIDVPPLDGAADLTLQIGPVLRGTALRDATGLVRFTDFVNQIQFAAVGTEMNNRAWQSALASLQPKSLQGREVRFCGAFAMEPDGPAQIRDVVPIDLEVQGARP
jgi:predicted lipoprotein